MKIGDIVIYNGQKAEIKEINYRDNGFGIIYIEGSKKGWEDWVISRLAMQKAD